MKNVTFAMNNATFVFSDFVFKIGLGFVSKSKNPVFEPPTF